MIALGQSALGVIAIGQLARGVVAIGQVAVGVIAVGQGAVGVVHAVAMLGVGGRGLGGVLRVAPKHRAFSVPTPAPPVPLASLEPGSSGWVRARLDAGGAPLGVGVSESSVDLSAVREQLWSAAATGEREACLLVHAEEEVGEQAAYRVAPPRTVRYRATAACTARPWRFPFESWSGHDEAPVWQLLVRALGFGALAFAWLAITGVALVDALR